MTNYEIVSKEVVSNKEAFDIVKERTKEIEPTYREEKIVEFLNKFPLHTKKDYLALKKELEALELARLDEAYLIKIIDLMPKKRYRAKSHHKYIGFTHCRRRCQENP